MSGDAQSEWTKKRRRGGVVNDQKSRAMVERAKQAVRFSVSAPRGQGGAAGGSKEVVFKVIHNVKSETGVRNVVDYISKDRDVEDTRANEEVLEKDLPSDGKDIPLWNQDGERLTRQQAQGELGTWDMKSNAENLSKKAQAAGPDARAAMALKERYRHRQGTHMLFSLPPRTKGGTDPQTLLRVTAATLDETFGRRGHRYIYAIHSENDRPHVHVVVNNLADRDPDRSRAGRLHLNRGDLDTIRHCFAENCRAAGLDVVATRRPDRPELRQKILNGEERARSKAKYIEAARKGDFLQDIKTRAPEWYEAHATNYLQGLERSYQEKSYQPARAGQGRGAEGRNGGDPLSRVFNEGYSDPKRARQSFTDLYKADKRLAVWAIEKRPELFGHMPQNGQKPNMSRVEIHGAMKGVPERKTAARDPRRRAAANEAVKTAQGRIKESQAKIQAESDKKHVLGVLGQLKTEIDGVGDPSLVAELRQEIAAADEGRVDPRGRAEVSRAGGRAKEAADDPFRKEKLRTPFEQRTRKTEPSFESWFRGSQATDENKNPLVLYHGSEEEFKGNPKPGYLDLIWTSRDRHFSETYGKHIKEYHIKAEKIFDGKIDEHRESIRKTLMKSEPDRADVLIEKMKEGTWGPLEIPNVQKAIREQGFDGIRAREAAHGHMKRSENYAVFKSAQLMAVEEAQKSRDAALKKPKPEQEDLTRAQKLRASFEKQGRGPGDPDRRVDPRRDEAKAEKERQQEGTERNQLQNDREARLQKSFQRQGTKREQEGVERGQEGAEKGQEGRDGPSAPQKGKTREQRLQTASRRQSKNRGGPGGPERGPGG